MPKVGQPGAGLRWPGLWCMLMSFSVAVKHSSIADAHGLGPTTVKLQAIESAVPPVVGLDDPPPGEQYPVMIEPRAHSALFLNFANPYAIGSLVGTVEQLCEPGLADAVHRTEWHASEEATALNAPHAGSAQDFLPPQHVLDANNSPGRGSGERCHRCHLRRAVRGHYNDEKQWTTLLCKVCLDALGEDARQTTLLLNSRCSDCTRVAAFGPPHGSNRLVLPSSDPRMMNKTIPLRSLPVHCKLHRAEGEIDVKHRRCTWQGPQETDTSSSLGSDGLPSGAASIACNRQVLAMSAASLSASLPAFLPRQLHAAPCRLCSCCYHHAQWPL